MKATYITCLWSAGKLPANVELTLLGATDEYMRVWVEIDGVTRGKIHADRIGPKESPWVWAVTLGQGGEWSEWVDCMDYVGGVNMVLNTVVHGN